VGCSVLFCIFSGGGEMESVHSLVPFRCILAAERFEVSRVDSSFSLTFLAFSFLRLVDRIVGRRRCT